ncbi:MAG: acyl-CoA dehydrogenase family protein, partial [Saprospiraceae bacterium]
MTSKTKGLDRYEGHDYYQIDELLQEDHLLAREAVRAWVKQEVSPIIEDYSNRAECPKHLFKGLAEIGAYGPSLPREYGGGGMDEIAYGIIMQELERGDSGIRSMASVQGSLVMFPIFKWGSEEQRRKYLPKLGSGEFIGCFGLTEPDYGSNPAGMVSTVKEDGDAYILNGAKMWITNSPVADIAVVWAKNEAGEILGMIVENGWKGYSAPEIHGKWSLRASITGELV